MLWLALHLPLLSLEAFCATLPAVPAVPREAQPSSKAVLLAEMAMQPVALVAAHRIGSVNRAAAARGIRPGLKRATALALAPDLLLADADAARDAAALQAMAHAALAFTPSVSLQGEQTVLLEVQGSLRLFGGFDSLCGRLRSSVQPLGHLVRMAAAPTALGAALLAQWDRPDSACAVQPGRSSRNPAAHNCTDLLCGPQADTALPQPQRLAALQTLLDAAPVWLLGPGREHWDALQGMGLQTLSDLRGLPRAGLARRFGDDLLTDLDCAFGRRPDPRQWVEWPSTFDTTLELFARADTTEQVLHGAEVLLTRLVVWAQARKSRVAAFTLRMRHEVHRGSPTPHTELQVVLAEPALDAAHLQLLLRERLARLELVAPTLDLHLHCSHLMAGPAPNGELFPTRASEAEGLVRLLERLRARLGDAQVQRLEAVADHRPEHASRSVPATGAPVPPMSMAAIAGMAAMRTLPLHRPLWLLPEPLPLAERQMLPLLNGQPLQPVSGPERIESGWWDGPPAVRDYFIVQDMDGSLLWIYRNRLPEGPYQADEPTWFLQGRFG